MTDAPVKLGASPFNMTHDAFKMTTGAPKMGAPSVKLEAASGECALGVTFSVQFESHHTSHKWTGFTSGI
jgi:hypothetical protein